MRTAQSTLGSFLFSIWMVVATIFFASSGWLTLFFPYPFRYWYITRWSHLMIASAKILCGIHYTIEGLEHLPTSPCVIAINHQSAWETLFLQVLLPRQTWVLKQELLWIPFFGWGLALLHPIAIQRKDKRAALKQLLDQGQKRLQEGSWVIIFPEGTRQPAGTLGALKRSAALLAKTAQVPLVPIAHNAGICWPKNSFLKTPGTIHVVIGKPILADIKTTDELHKELTTWLEQHVRLLTEK